MSETTTDNAAADEDADEQFTYYPQVTSHPTVGIEGNVVDIVTGATIDGDVEDSGASFGVLFEDATVPKGTIWKNRDIPEGFSTTSEYNDTLRLAIEGDDNDYVRGQEVTDESIEAAQERLDEAGVDYEGADYDDLRVKGTDYKVADPEDQAADVQEVDGTTLGIDVGGGVFSAEQVDGFTTDRIMVWYDGVSGQRVGRALDFNGMPFARYTEDGYLIKGLFQAPKGWRGDADVEQYDDVPTTDRSELASKRDGLGRPPRTARPPVLRDDIDGRIFIATGRYNGGRMHEVHVGRAMDDYDGFFETLAANERPDYDEVEMKYDQDAEETLADAFEDPSQAYGLYHGAGWMPKPDNAQDFGGDGGDDTEGGSFDMSMADDSDDGVDHPTEQETQFGEMVAEKLAGTGADPSDEVFEAGGESVSLDGLVEANEGNFDADPDVDAIRSVIEDNVDHL
jgi:hypothetical protein